MATPAPPSLSLPYKYKLLEDMFRGMDTVVSMLHNRSEICTFSKLKSAVQEMTKRYSWEDVRDGETVKILKGRVLFEHTPGRGLGIV